MNDRTVNNLADVTATHGVVTIGTFDGVHLGHQALLRGAVKRAAELRVPVLVVTFEPIPASVLRPEQFLGRICPVDEKLNAIAHAGPDQILIYEFTREFAQLTAAEFMESITSATHLRELWVGEEFALGRGRSGGVEQLAELGASLGYAVRAFPRREDQDGVISSSRIRHAVQLGDVSLANRLLGR
ncbi:MAG: FAD synthetase family protein, partial [Chloroflexota bacterium]|nr:FAD synthetase family protein [Chloroflexota bacterium]